MGSQVIWLQRGWSETYSTNSQLRTLDGVDYWESIESMFSAFRRFGSRGLGGSSPS